MSYASVIEFKQQVPLAGNQSDNALQFLLDTATDQINTFCKRPDGFVAQVTFSARLYSLSGFYFVITDEFTELEKVYLKDSFTSDFEEIEISTVIPFAGSNVSPKFNRKPYTGIMLQNPSNRVNYRVDNSSFGPIGDHPIFPQVQVFAKWGYSEDVPNPVKLACIIQASRWLKRSQGAWQDSMASAEFGEMTITQVIDPTVKEILMLGGFVKPVI